MFTHIAQQIICSVSDAFPFGDWDSLGMLALASGGMNGMSSPLLNSLGGNPWGGLGGGLGGWGSNLGGLGGLGGMGLGGMGMGMGMPMTYGGMAPFGNTGRWDGFEGRDTRGFNMDGTRWQS